MDPAGPEDVIEALAASRARLDALLRGADLDAWVNEATGRRAIDVVAHVAQWDEHAAASLEAFAAGREFRLAAPFEIHAENQRIFERHRARPRADVLAFLDASRRRLVAAARSVPAARWGGPVTCPWGAKCGVAELLADMRGHEEHHGKQIRAAR
jgi:hypothetical protein